MVEPAARLSVLVMLAAFSLLERSQGLPVSGPPWLLWAVYVTTSGLLLLYRCLSTDDDALDASFVAFGVLALVSFVLSFWPDAAKSPYAPPAAVSESEKTCPAMTSGFPSRMTFSWFTAIAWQGFKRNLGFEDLWDLPPSIRAERVFEQFEKNMHKKNHKVVSVSAENAETNGIAMEMKAQKEENDSSPKRTISMLSPLMATFGSAFVLGSVFKLANDCMIFVPPYILKLIIQFVEGESSYPWRGVLLCCVLLIATSFQTILLSQYFYKMYLIGLKVRSAMIVALYKKSLSVSMLSTETSTGEIVNLMSVDIQRIVDMMPYLNMMWR